MQLFQLSRTTMSLMTILLALASLAASQSNRTCPNINAYHYPATYGYETAGFDMMTYLIPINTSIVQSLIGPMRTLLPVPDGLLPDDFTNNTHPVSITIGCATNMTMYPQVLDDMMVARVTVPYVDALNDGKTPFQVPLRWFYGSASSNLPADPRPAMLAAAQSALGYNIAPGYFTYPGVPYGVAHDFSDEYYAQDVTTPPDTQFWAVSAELNLPSYGSTPQGINDTTFYNMTNQPMFLSTGLCQRSMYVTDPDKLPSNATYYEGSVDDVDVPGQSADFGYIHRHAMAACVNLVKFPVQDCREAAAGQYGGV